ncbi:hypothetical protein CQW23_14731 [Capsicum baccatum]|uniref:PB1-like domain-containing protein n=1 Tax=Capsicum baccatum TaxID=33114 RepID=A0A2G2WK05_CAPBA|nr:hypothetical protein CQW23_14731 [Capsicum baccatum]
MLNCGIDNNDVEPVTSFKKTSDKESLRDVESVTSFKKTSGKERLRDVESVMSFKKTSSKENLPKQHVDESIYSGNVDMVSEVTIIYHYGGYFKFRLSKEYVSGHLMNTTMDIDFMSYFDMLDDLKKHCKFFILDGDKFFYLRGDKIMNDYDGLVECCDDSDVKDMLFSYKMYKEKPIEIYTLSKNYDIFEDPSLEENNYRDNVSEGVNEAVEEHEPTN